MHTLKHITLAAAACLTLAGAAALSQQAVPTTQAIGPVDLTYRTGASYTRTQARVTGNVQLHSQTFAAQAEVITLDLAAKAQNAGPGGIRKVIMEPLPGKQVSGNYEDIAQGRRYQFQADHAVYVPDNARPGGGRIDLTGHVRVAVNAPVALDGPLVTVTDHAVVLLGQGTEYPKVETGAGHVTFTPLSGGK